MGQSTEQKPLHFGTKNRTGDQPPIAISELEYELFLFILG